MIGAESLDLSCRYTGSNLAENVCSFAKPDLLRHVSWARHSAVTVGMGLYTFFSIRGIAVVVLRCTIIKKLQAFNLLQHWLK